MTLYFQVKITLKIHLGIIMTECIARQLLLMSLNKHDTLTKLQIAFRGSCGVLSPLLS